MTPRRPKKAKDAPLSWLEHARRLSDRIEDLEAERVGLREALGKVPDWTWSEDGDEECPFCHLKRYQNHAKGCYRAPEPVCGTCGGEPHWACLPDAVCRGYRAVFGAPDCSAVPCHDCGGSR